MKDAATHGIVHIKNKFDIERPTGDINFTMSLSESSFQATNLKNDNCFRLRYLKCIKRKQPKTIMKSISNFGSETNYCVRKMILTIENNILFIICLG